MRSRKAGRKRAIEASTPESVPRAQKKVKLEWKNIGEVEEEEEEEERDGNRSGRKLKVALKAAAKKGILKQTPSRVKRGGKSRSETKHVRFSLEQPGIALLGSNTERIEEHGILLNRSGGSEGMEDEDSSESDGFIDDEDMGMGGEEEVEEEWEEEEEEEEDEEGWEVAEEEEEEEDEEEGCEEEDEDVGEEDKGSEDRCTSGSSVLELAPDSPATKYVPPNSRGGSGAGDGERRILEKLRKRVQGLINR